MNEENVNYKRVTLSLTKNHNEKLKQIAKRENSDKSKVVRKLIEDYEEVYNKNE